MQQPLRTRKYHGSKHERLAYTAPLCESIPIQEALESRNTLSVVSRSLSKIQVPNWSLRPLVKAPDRACKVPFQNAIPA